ncbi:MAG: hypothetical protein MJE66_06965 [Proteobacteria bacterium]|nr:hypothetical protein [Pseudomonadota bacterium]
MGRAAWWIGLAIVYGAFWIWYGGAGDPLTPEEVERLVGRMVERGAGDGDLEALRRFGESDDGREFFMVNLVEYRERPAYADGRDPETDDPQEVDRRYTRFMLPRLVLRACHPVALGERIATLAHYDGAPDWSRAAVVRYRSRRDFLELVTDPAWAEHAVHKWAAVERTHSFPSAPLFSLFGPRFAVLVLLGTVGLAGNALIARRAARPRRIF